MLPVTSGKVNVRVVPVVTPDTWNCARLLLSRSSRRTKMLSSKKAVPVATVIPPLKVQREVIVGDALEL